MEGANVRQTRSPLAYAKPRVLLPVYSEADVLGLFAQFLRSKGFIYTRAMLLKELQHNNTVKPTLQAADLSEDELKAHLAFCMAQLQGSRRGSAPAPTPRPVGQSRERDRRPAELSPGLERVGARANVSGAATEQRHPTSNRVYSQTGRRSVRGPSEGRQEDRDQPRSQEAEKEPEAEGAVRPAADVHTADVLLSEQAVPDRRGAVTPIPANALPVGAATAAESSAPADELGSAAAAAAVQEDVPASQAAAASPTTRQPSGEEPEEPTPTAMEVDASAPHATLSAHDSEERPLYSSGSEQQAVSQGGSPRHCPSQLEDTAAGGADQQMVVAATLRGQGRRESLGRQGQAGATIWDIMAEEYTLDDHTEMEASDAEASDDDRRRANGAPPSASHYAAREPKGDGGGAARGDCRDDRASRGGSLDGDASRRRSSSRERLGGSGCRDDDRWGSRQQDRHDRPPGYRERSDSDTRRAADDRRRAPRGRADDWHLLGRGEPAGRERQYSPAAARRSPPSRPGSRLSQPALPAKRSRSPEPQLWATPPHRPAPPGPPGNARYLVDRRHTPDFPASGSRLDPRNPPPRTKAGLQRAPFFVDAEPPRDRGADRYRGLSSRPALRGGREADRDRSPW